MVNPIIYLILFCLGFVLGIKVTTTQNPVYSGLYLVLIFIFGSGIGFLLGLEFIGLLFLLVYAGAIAVLVLFVVMMLDVKAIENPWSARRKQVLYLMSLIFLFVLGLLNFSEYFSKLFSNFLSGLCHLSFGGGFEKTFENQVQEIRWAFEFDTFCALNNPSYLLYSTHAILLIIAGVILLIAMVGAISLTLEKNCPESLYRQLGRESKNSIFLIREKNSFDPKS